MTRGRFLGRITGGRLERMSSPRIGIERPRMNNVITITTNGTASVKPCLPQSGHQSLVLDRNWSSDCTTPNASEPISAIQSELSRAMRAPANAGTTSSVKFTGVSAPMACPAQIMMNETNTVESTHVTMPSMLGRESGERCRPLVLGGGLDGDAGAGVAEPEGQRGTQHDHDADEPEPVDRHLGAADRDVTRRKEGGANAGVGAVLEGEGRLQREHDADGGHDLGEHRRVAQRSRYEHLDGGPEHGGHAEGDEDLHPQRHRQVVRRYPRQWQRELARLEVAEDVQGHRRHGRGGEVDDAGALVRQHDALRQRSVDGADADAEDEEQDVLAHARDPSCSTAADQ